MTVSQSKTKEPNISYFQPQLKRGGGCRAQVTFIAFGGSGGAGEDLCRGALEALEELWRSSERSSEEALKELWRVAGSSGGPGRVAWALHPLSPPALELGLEILFFGVFWFDFVILSSKN